MPLRMSWILFNIVILCSYEWNGYTEEASGENRVHLREKKVYKITKSAFYVLFTSHNFLVWLLSNCDPPRTTDVCLLLVILWKWIFVYNVTLILIILLKTVCSYFLQNKIWNLYLPMFFFYLFFLRLMFISTSDSKVSFSICFFQWQSSD